MNRFLKAGIAGFAMSFAASAAPAQQVGEAAPELTMGRIKAVEACFAKFDAMRLQLDTRQESAHEYYFDNEDNRTAIRTAVATGNFDREVDMVSELGQFTMSLAISLTSFQRSMCMIDSDENGDLGPQETDLAGDFMKALVEKDTKMLGIMKKLKTAGDELLAAGATPPAVDNLNAMLFR